MRLELTDFLLEEFEKNILQDISNKRNDLVKELVNICKQDTFSPKELHFAEKRAVEIFSITSSIDKIK